MRNGNIIPAAALVLAAVAISWTPARAGGGAAAVSQVTGEVEVRISGAAWKSARANDVLSGGDSVRTGAASKAKLMLPGGATVVVGALTIFNVKDVDPGYSTGAGANNLSVDKGAARVTVPKGSGTKSTFTVSTPTAIAGVRGTDFSVEVSEEDETTLVTVFEGAVEVGSLLEDIKEKFLVEKDQETEIRRGEAPARPRILDKERRREIIERLSRGRRNDKPDEEEDAADRRARGVAAASAGGFDPEKRDKIAGRIASGDIDPAVVEKIVESGVRGGNPELAGRVLEAVSERGVPDDARAKLATMLEKGGSTDVEARLKSLIGDNATREKVFAARKEILDSMDKGKADEALSKLGPDSPQRKEMQLIREAIEKGVPRERIDLLLTALDKGLLDPREARILIQALAKNVEGRDIMTALQRLRNIKADRKLRALVFKAVTAGVDLRAVFEKLQESGLTLEQIKQRLAEIIKAKLAAAQPK